MNNIDLIKEKQPIVFSTLERSLKNKQVSHAYLFSGVKGSLQYETAILFAQSLVCTSKNTWACGVCDSCHRIEIQTYPDFIIIDGENQSIKKEDVLYLQKQFSLTALEASSSKIFLIKGAENMTISAANSLLKFLEEPSRDVYGILVSDDTDSMLKTILSRCTLLNFKTIGYQSDFRKLIAEGVNPRDAYYYSTVAKTSISKDTFCDDETFVMFKEVFEQFTELFVDNPDQALFIVHHRMLSHKDKSLVDHAFKLFLEMLTQFYNDIISGQHVDGWYDEQLDVYRKKTNYLQLLEITLNIKSKIKKHINTPLIMDQMMFQFREVV